MRAVLAMSVLVAGCIAAEPGKETPSASPRKACTELEGLTFSSPVGPQSVAFVTDDVEYSTYTETAADGTQSMGLAQCITANNTNIIYIDGATDHWSARADVPPAGTDIYLQWTDGHSLTALNVVGSR